MAVVLGTNAGFVTVAPIADPNGNNQNCDTWALASKDTSPAVLTKISEVGWYCNAATEESNFEIGLYAHDVGNDKPAARLYVTATNAKGTSAGWKTAAVDWTIVPETIYWIAVQLDDTATTTSTDASASTGGYRFSYKTAQTTLTDPWGASNEQANYALATYALVEEGDAPSELLGTIVAESTTSGGLSGTFNLAGTIANSTSVSGIFRNTTVGIVGIITDTTTVSGVLRYTAVNVKEQKVYRRLVAVGNDILYYEAI